MARLRARDHTVWQAEPTGIQNRLGWLQSASDMQGELVGVWIASCMTYTPRDTGRRWYEISSAFAAEVRGPPSAFGSLDIRLSHLALLQSPSLLQVLLRLLEHW
jgi:hypothetical protein